MNATENDNIISNEHVNLSASSSSARYGARCPVHFSPLMCSTALEVGVILMLLMRKLRPREGE